MARSTHQNGRSKPRSCALPSTACEDYNLETFRNYPPVHMIQVEEDVERSRVFCTHLNPRDVTVVGGTLPRWNDFGRVPTQPLERRAQQQIDSVNYSAIMWLAHIAAVYRPLLYPFQQSPTPMSLGIVN